MIIKNTNRVKEMKEIESWVKLFGYIFGAGFGMYLTWLIQDALILITMFPFAIAFDLWILNYKEYKDLKWASTAITIASILIALLIKNPSILFG